MHGPSHARRIVLVAALLVSAASTRAQAPREADLLGWTSEVGRMLYSYYAALGVATAAVDAVTDARPPLYAGGPYDEGWAFSFGTLEADSTFVIPYGVIVDGNGEIVAFERFEQRRVASP